MNITLRMNCRLASPNTIMSARALSFAILISSLHSLGCAAVQAESINLTKIQKSNGSPDTVM